MAETDLTITLAGNATVLIRDAHLAVLTDPWLTDRLGPLRRLRPCGIAASDLPPLAAVLISHGHPDHLHPESLAALARAAPVLCPGGTPFHRLKGLGFAARRMEPWESWEREHLCVTAVPCVHTRWSLGFVIGMGGRRIYFAADAAPRTPFAEIARRCGPLDAALLPVGGSSLAVGPLQRHLTPEAAVRAALELQPRLVLPMHWGHMPCVPPFLDRFRGTGEQFVRLMRNQAPEIAVVWPEDGRAVGV